MKIGIYSDAHFSVGSSILVGRDKESLYSKRLSSLISSFDWMYGLFRKEDVELIVDCGDLTDSDTLTAEESSALSEALLKNSSKIPEIHLLGNHEIKDSDKKFTAINILTGYPHIELVKEFTVRENLSNCSMPLIFAPYASDQESLSELQAKLLEIDKPSVVFSHLVYLSDELLKKNGFLGISGVDKDVVCSNNNIQYIFNGHLHNPISSDNYIQVGSLIGNGFGDSYSEGLPRVIILDTESKTFRSYENPSAVLFYKLSCKSLAEFSKKFKRHEQRCCIQVTVPISIREALSQFLSKNKEALNLEDYRVRSEVISAGELEGDCAPEYLVERIEKIGDSKSIKELVQLFIQQSESLPYSELDMLNFVDSYFKE